MKNLISGLNQLMKNILLNWRAIRPIKFLVITTVFLSIGLFVSSASLKPNEIASIEEGLYQPLAGWDGVSIGGYGSKISVAQGESLNFHISTDLSTYSLTIWREGVNRQLMLTTGNLPGAKYSCIEGYNPPGCGWPVAYTLTVPPSWPSGVYTVDIPTKAKGTQSLIFWVREDQLGSTGPILFLSAVNTYHAYTNFGGKSLYNDSSSNNQRAYKVSFNRPFKNSGLGDFGLEKKVITWAEGQGYKLEYGAESDLEFIPNLLDAYEVVVIAGHSEYWSWNMRQRLKAFINNGGRFINLSGNTMWWQVRYEDNGRTLVGYKDYKLDPATSPQEDTFNPWDHPIYDAEYTLTGAHWRSGGYFNSSNDPTYRYSDGYGGYWVQRTGHWVFAGTGLNNGEVLGRAISSGNVIGAENDGTTFNCGPDGRTILGPLANTGTPSNFTILGVAPVSRNGDLGFAVMGLYTVPSGGAVFSVNSTGWPGALTNSRVAQITRNVFDHFLAHDFPAEPVSSSDTDYLFYDRFNCSNMDHAGVLSSYTGPKWYEGVPSHNYVDAKSATNQVRYSYTCGIGQGSGLEITVNAQNKFRYQSQLKPNWQTTDVLYTRMYLDFSKLSMAEGNQFSLMKQFNDNRQTKLTTLTDLSIRRRNGQLQIFYKDVSTGLNTGWVNVPMSRPFLLETMWDKPNKHLSLWINGVRYDRTVDLTSRPSMNRVDMMIAALDTGTQGILCLDELAFDNAIIGPLPANAGIVYPGDIGVNSKIYLPVISTE